jgi:hypothetical protein
MITLIGHQPIDFTYGENGACENLSNMCLQYEVADNPMFQIKSTTGTAPLVTIQGIGNVNYPETTIPASLYSIIGDFYSYTLNFEELGISSGCYEVCVYEISATSGINLVENGDFDSDLSGWTSASGVSIDIDSYTEDSVTLVASGGIAPYTYAVDEGDYQVSETFTELTPGTSYTFYAKDVNGVIGSIIFTLRDCSLFAGSYAADIVDIQAVEIKDCYANDFV